MATKGSQQSIAGGRAPTGDAVPASAAPARNVAATPAVVAPAVAATVAPDPAPIGAAATPRIDLQITLVCGGITNVATPVVIGARYDGLAFAGPTRVFDRLLDSWLTRAVDLGIIGSCLGQLFLINLEQFQRAGRLKADNLLLAGMGEPGQFAQDSLQFIISNLIVAIKVMGHHQFATSLIGTRRNELSIADALRALIQGVHDGYERIKTIATDDSSNRDVLRRAAAQPLALTLVHADAKKLDAIAGELDALVRESPWPDIKLTSSRGADVKPDPDLDPRPIDVEPDRPVSYLRITRSKSAAAAMRGKGVFPGRKKPAAHGAVDPFMTDVFQFSALSDTAVVPQREQEVNTHLLRDLADRMTKDGGPEDRGDLGAFFASILVPDDFRKLTEGPANLTLEVDETTAVYPWEMAASKRYAKASFLATTTAISRQFRSLLSPPPTSPPALNHELKALIIADPAGDELALPHARDEGATVVEVLEQARKAWGDRYKISVKVRIGPAGDPTVQALLDNLERQNQCVVSAKPCDPLELAMLVVNEQFDLIHYAGHGISDAKTGQTGWVFASDCILSAKEIFKVRQVPRLVFANACFSAVTTDHNEQRKHMAGLAQAFFGRGIPNFIGAGWQVDDACAAECAKWFYARLMGLVMPSASGGVIGTAPPATIGEALKMARGKVFELNARSPSWGAYQHYGRVGDKLVAMPNAAPAATPDAGTPSADPVIVPIRSTQVVPPRVGDVSMAPAPQPAAAAAPSAVADPDLVYVNGIDLDTGRYAFAPRSIDQLARQVLADPGLGKFAAMHVDRPRSFGISFDMDPEKLESAGWGIVFHEDTAQDVRDALAPLTDWRKTQAGDRHKVLDYKKGEQLRDWYQRHHISPGAIDAEIVPFYLMLIGPPTLIPFEFEYLLGIEYATGRLAFDRAEDYAAYARSTVAYERAASVPNAKQITFWGTRHPNDPATNLSAASLVDPLANGMAAADGALKRPIHLDVGYDQKLMLGDDATKANLVATLHAGKPPALLFTASHGMSLRSGQAAQAANQGALLCQDWPGGSVKAEHFLAAADIADDANVNGMVLLLFACFGAGTPDVDQFLTDPAQAGELEPLAPQPFIAALPRRLLAHPKGSALAVIGHVDRAWEFSIAAPKNGPAQIKTFRDYLGIVLSGKPVGMAMTGLFGARFATLSTALASATSPTAPAASRLSDRDLVTYWLERNDAQNYVLLGDPAVRIRKDLLTPSS